MNSLEELAQAVATCTKCPLSRTATRPVPGEGPPDAKIMFIGEAPGYYEDQQGRPFVGAAGQLLEEMLRSIGLSRRDVYITNILKHRPPGNRDPEPAEIEACNAFLDAQIALIQPRLICTLGRFSMAKFFGKGSMRALHGRTVRYGAITCYALYHPAAVLRDPRLKDVFAEDFRRIPQVLAEAEAAAAKAAATSREPAPAAPAAEQLSLF
ncbi:MAG TPA: uracil-DNA glycosylase [Chloroflexota bacterium]|nr:uracil-DNA glycosylase [Chloroflexota bacterium]